MFLPRFAVRGVIPCVRFYARPEKRPRGVGGTVMNVFHSGASCEACVVLVGEQNVVWVARLLEICCRGVLVSPIYLDTTGEIFTRYTSMNPFGRDCTRRRGSVRLTTSAPSASSASNILARCVFYAEDTKVFVRSSGVGFSPSRNRTCEPDTPLSMGSCSARPARRLFRPSRAE